MKISLLAMMAMALVMSACNTRKTTLTPEEQVRVEEQKALPKTLKIDAGTYNVTATCADTAKTDKLKNLHWIVTLKDDGHYLESLQNFDSKCEDACSSVEGGVVKFTELQSVFTVTQRLNISKNQFEAVPNAVAKNYFVMGYDRMFGKIVLIDNSDMNLCQGKMILTLQN